MSKGRHKGKIQLSIGLPIPIAHPIYPIEMMKKIYVSILAKTLSACYYYSTFLKLNKAQFLSLPQQSEKVGWGKQKDREAGKGRRG